MVKIASSLGEFLSAFRLIYEAYTRAGLATQNPLRLRITPYQLLPSTEVLVAIDGQRTICTMSLVRDGLLGLPLEDVYAEEISLRRRAGLVLAEVSCLANARESDRTAFAPVLRLMSLCAQIATARGVDQLVIAVHPRHSAFYQRYLGFERFGELQRYEAVHGAPALGLVLDLNQLADRHPAGYARLYGRPFPPEALMPREMPDELRRELARRMPDLATSNESVGVPVS